MYMFEYTCIYLVLVVIKTGKILLMLISYITASKKGIIKLLKTKYTLCDKSVRIKYTPLSLFNKMLPKKRILGEI